MVRPSYDTKSISFPSATAAENDRVMRSQWVLTWKSTSKAKARLGQLGIRIENQDLTENARGNPAPSAHAGAIIFQWVASNRVKPVPGDIKTTFRSRSEESRYIFLPPEDVRNILELAPESKLRLRKAMHGLVNAPKTWWSRLKRVFPSLLKRPFVQRQTCVKVQVQRTTEKKRCVQLANVLHNATQCDSGKPPRRTEELSSIASVRGNTATESCGKQTKKRQRARLTSGLDSLLESESLHTRSGLRWKPLA